MEYINSDEDISSLLTSKVQLDTVKEEVNNANSLYYTDKKPTKANKPLLSINNTFSVELEEDGILFYRSYYGERPFQAIDEVTFSISRKEYYENKPYSSVINFAKANSYLESFSQIDRFSKESFSEIEEVEQYQKDIGTNYGYEAVDLANRNSLTRSHRKNGVYSPLYDINEYPFLLNRSIITDKKNPPSTSPKPISIHFTAGYTPKFASYNQPISVKQTIEQEVSFKNIPKLSVDDLESTDYLLMKRMRSGYYKKGLPALKPQSPNKISSSDKLPVYVVYKNNNFLLCHGYHSLRVSLEALREINDMFFYEGNYLPLFNYDLLVNWQSCRDEIENTDDYEHHSAFEKYLCRFVYFTERKYPDQIRKAITYLTANDNFGEARRYNLKERGNYKQYISEGFNLGQIAGYLKYMMSKRKVDLVKQVIESRIRNYQEIIYANRFDAGPDVKFLAQVQRAINCNKDLLSKLELLRSFELTEDHCSKCLEMIAYKKIKETMWYYLNKTTEDKNKFIEEELGMVNI